MTSDAQDGSSSSTRPPVRVPTWSDLAAGCATIDGLSEADRAAARAAFMFLEGALGDGFLVDAFAARHPLCFPLINPVAWTRRQLTWLASALQAFQGSTGYASLRARIMHQNKYQEGRSVLRAADRFRRQNFDVAFDPSVPVGPTSKMPDLKLGHDMTDRPIHVEVSIVGESVRETEATRTAQSIFLAVIHHSPFLHFAGHIQRSLAPRHLADVLVRVRDATQRARSENTFLDASIENVLTLGLAPESDLPSLQRWCATHKVEVGNLGGPPFDANEAVRTRGAIGREQRQLPPDGYNIVLIENSALFLHAPELPIPVSELEEELFKYPHIFAAVVSGAYLGRQESLGMMIDKHAYFAHSSHDDLAEQHLVLWNRYADTCPPEPAVSAAYQAFAQPL